MSPATYHLSILLLGIGAGLSRLSEVCEDLGFVWYCLSRDLRPYESATTRQPLHILHACFSLEPEDATD